MLPILEISHKCNNINCGLLWLVSITLHNVFNVFPYGSIYQYFVTFYRQTGRPGNAVVHGVTKSQTQLSDWTEQNMPLYEYTTLCYPFILLTFNQPFFPLCDSFWIVSIAISSTSLIFSPVLSNLLLGPFSEFFISNIVFFTYAFKIYFKVF